MNARYAVLIAVGAALAAVPVSAVPPRPVNALSVTMLPADGTPEELRKLVAAFGKSVAKANSDANEKRTQLDRQMAEGLDKAIAKAQSSGDINMVLALKAAKDQFATLTTSDVPLVQNALEFREKKTVEIETARVADTMKAAKNLNDELEKAKKDETVKGNFDTAKAIADHQEKVVAWSKTLRSAAPQPTPTSTRPLHPRPNAQPDPVRTRTESPRTIIVQATNSEGTSIGFAKTGDVLKIQYVSGTWVTGYGIVESPDATALRRRDDRCVIVRRDNPAFHVKILPAGTKQTPYSFTVPQDGEYALRAWDGMSDYSPGYVNDNRGSVQYSVQRFQSGAPSPNSSATSVIHNPNAIMSPVAPVVQTGQTGSKKIVSINANRAGGTSIGHLNEGDTVRIRYVSGKWTYNTNAFRKVSPDEEWGDWNLCQTQLTVDPGSLFVAAVPKHTAEDPFEYVIEESATYRLRIKDLGVGDSNGIVQYEVEIIPAGSK